MKALKTVLAGGAAIAALTVAAPASAQIFPNIGGYGGTGGIIGQVLGSVISQGMGGGYGYSNPYGYSNSYGYGGNYGSPYAYGSPYGYSYGYNSPYGNVGYGSPYGYGGGNISSGQMNQFAVGQCMGAVQQKLNAGYARNTTAGARVLGVSDVQRRSNGGTLVSGVANSGRTSGYGYEGQGQVDLTFTCKTDRSGNVSSIEIGQAEYVNGQVPAYSPYGTDYSQYGYSRY